ncbi:xanthine dehydrogenase small subunit [Leekyejoonella antrihumi]|uniref:2Fe-2S iron-sulfur cluster binding domain-containing protein n=1 Tax=Leekyejoonella antrihumi TaxID=1660198 RepID=A0A563DWF3_9MICO|nr:FAD binding domain-containing protein [Leekyejoonella antrihumi]TWP34535.1 2Fe-2S iron-sulfur cluster binding domain-containing protein [Leekyejoonella antrihumi]
MSSLQATVNGQEASLSGVSAHTTMLDWLRDQGLTGAKEGCAEGECGACAVLVARPDADGGTTWTSINACLIPAACVDGQEVVTSEGLSATGRLHPVQEEMATRGGSQCGYCTPGFVCSMAAEFYRSDRCPAGSPPACGGHEGDAEHGPNGFDIHALSGNLCRCTGYRPIRDAAYAVGQASEDDPMAKRRSAPAPAAAATRFSGPDGDFVRPADLAEALTVLGERPDATLVAGSTDWGVDVNIKGVRSPLVVAIDRLSELRTFELPTGPLDTPQAGTQYIELGAALTLSEIERRLAGRVPLLEQLFPQFASRLIRNGATIGGNLGTSSPIGDMPPVLLALNAVLVLASARGEREVPLVDYFTGYRQSVRAADELIKAVRIPTPLAPITAFHKIAKRRFDDISSVAVGYAVDVQDGVVSRAAIGLGGIAATPIRARETESALIGRPWTAATVQHAANVLGGEGTPMDDHRASARYRTAMLEQSLLKLHAENPSLQEV